MVIALMLPWFPILIAVAVSGRLLGPARGLVLGALCALFWVAVVQASIGASIWMETWTIATIVTGAIAIIAVGRWAGDLPFTMTTHAGEAATAPSPQRVAAVPEADADGLTAIAAAIEQFDDWLAANKDVRDPWPAFGEFVRGVIYRTCGGTHVRTYRLVSEGRELAPLHDLEAAPEGTRLPAREGVLGHVITSGRSYLSAADQPGDLIGQLAYETGNDDAWCFAVCRGAQRVGAVSVGRLNDSPRGHTALLGAVERLVSQFWCTLTECCYGRHAEQEDAVSGAQTRPAFLRAGERTVAESYRMGEPVAVAVFSLEGLRHINDSGRWDLGDELLREVCDVLRRKVRMDDHLGRFDGSRFVLLLRRVDSGLAGLIINQMVARVQAVIEDESRWMGPVRVRCGLVGSGTQHPDLRELVSRALIQCRCAREQDVGVSSDVEAAACAATEPVS